MIITGSGQDCRIDRVAIPKQDHLMTCSVVSCIYTPKSFAGGVSSSESKQSDGINNTQIQILEILLSSILVATGHIDITKRLEVRRRAIRKPNHHSLFFSTTKISLLAKRE